MTQAVAGAAARLGRLQDRELQARLGDRLDPGQGLLGRRPAGECRAQQFRPAPVRLHPGRERRMAGLHQGRVRGHPDREQLQRWATEYNFPASRPATSSSGNSDESGEPMQGFVLNMRRPQFQDRRVRQALTLAFNFESMNRTLFYGLNTRTDSYFEGQDLASSGLPTGKELELLNAYKDKLPPELFTQPIQAAGLRFAAGRTPVSASRPSTLFAEAGWKISGGKMLNDKTASSSGSRSSATPDRRAHLHHLCREPAARSASTPRCASSTRRNMSTATAISTSTA